MCFRTRCLCFQDCEWWKASPALEIGLGHQEVFLIQKFCLLLQSCVIIGKFYLRKTYCEEDKTVWCTMKIYGVLWNYTVKNLRTINYFTRAFTGEQIRHFTHQWHDSEGMIGYISWFRFFHPLVFFQLRNVLYLFLDVIDHMPHWSKLILLRFWNY